MSQLKPVKIFSDRREAEFAENSLKSLGIESFLRGSKEYTSHILGGEAGRYELLVNSDDFDRAKNHLDGPKLKLAEPEVAEDPSGKKTRYLKKAIIFSVYATVFLPLIFNYFAVQNLISYRALETDSFRRIWVSLLVMLMQLPILFYLYLIIEKFL